MTTWKCSVCGFTREGNEPPEPCPGCQSSCSFVDASCYTPDCGGADSGNINPDVGREGEGGE